MLTRVTINQINYFGIEKVIVKEVVIYLEKSKLSKNYFTL